MVWKVLALSSLYKRDNDVLYVSFKTEWNENDMIIKVEMHGTYWEIPGSDN